MRVELRRAGAVALALACLGPVVVTAAPSAVAADCRAALVTVAGSGQRSGSPEMRRVADVVRAEAAKAGTSVVVRAADYPAVPWWRYVQPGLRWDWDGLERSERDGVTSVLAHVNALRRICATRPILLAGYSQGADVVIRAVGSMGPVQRRTVSAALFGSPSFRPGLPQDRGTFDARRRGIRPANRQNTFDLSPDVAPRTVDVCLRYDSICNFSVADAPNLANGTDAHYRYVRSGWADRAAARLWAMRNGADITLTSVALSGTASAPDYTWGVQRPVLSGASAGVTGAWRSATMGIVQRKRTALVEWQNGICTEPAPYCSAPSTLDVRWKGRTVMASRYASVVLLSTYYAAAATVNQNDADTLTMSLTTGRVLRLGDVLDVSRVRGPVVRKMTAEGVAPGGRFPHETRDRCGFTESFDVSSLRDYTAGRHGITFWFDRYEASFGACSQTAVTMSWREVGPFLTAAGRDLRMVAAL